MRLKKLENDEAWEMVFITYEKEHYKITMAWKLAFAQRELKI